MGLNVILGLLKCGTPGFPGASAQSPTEDAISVTIVKRYLRSIARFFSFGEARDARWVYLYALLICHLLQNRTPSYLVAFQLMPNLNFPTIGIYQQMPCIATICNICGNTQFHNVFVLGIGHLFGLNPTGGMTPPPGSER